MGDMLELGGVEAVGAVMTVEHSTPRCYASSARPYLAVALANEAPWRARPLIL